MAEKAVGQEVSKRQRRMVEIDDATWQRLEHLARVYLKGEYLYKGRVRYGRTLARAVEVLESSLIEWTEEELEEDEQEWWGDEPEGEETIEWGAKKGWWKGDKLDAYKPKVTTSATANPSGAGEIHKWWNTDEAYQPNASSNAAKYGFALDSTAASYSLKDIEIAVSK